MVTVVGMAPGGVNAVSIAAKFAVPVWTRVRMSSLAKLPSP